MKRIILVLAMIAVGSVNANAQFRIKIPEITKPKVEKPNQPEQPAEQARETPVSGKAMNRQLVMDDGYTFFDAEPVKEYDQKLRLNKDIGWYLRSDLRMFGTFPNRSAFKVVVKNNGQQLAEIRCEAGIYQKSNDPSLRTEMQQKNKDLNFDDFMFAQRCYNEEAVIKPAGKLDVEIYFIDGDTDAEKLVRTYKIDVHKATRVRGSTTNPQPDVSHYYIQRHPESAVAFIHVTGNHTGSNRSDGRNYFFNDPSTGDTPGYGQLVAYFSYSEARSTKSFGSTFARCSVNGQRVSLERDAVSLNDLNKQEYAIYTDRLAEQYKRGSEYRDDVKFKIYAAALPLYTGEGEYSKPPMKIEDSPGQWECELIANGVKLRTLRWEVGSDGNIVPHAEQASGNVNLYYRTYLVDMEIPADGAPFDYRLMPMPEMGLFYGIPWATDEGRNMAAAVPKKGNPFHVPSNKK